MNILPPSLPEEVAAETRRRDEVRAARWPVVVGLIATLFFHAVLFVAAPHLGFEGGGVSVPDDVTSLREKYDKQELTFLLADAEPPPRPQRFVEVNPDAPENDPGKTDNYGARNQQAAQPEPGNDHSDRAKTTGELDESTAVVTGSRQPPVEAMPLSGADGQGGSGMTAVVVGNPNQPKASDPLPGLEKIIGDNPDGIGTNIGKSPTGKADAEKAQAGKNDGDGAAQQLVAVSGGGIPGAPGRPSPKPRPKLQNVRPTVLANQPLSASNAGAAAVNSRLSEAGVWWDEFISTVDAQFQKLAEEMTARPPARSTVVVRFMVNTRGEVRILDVQGESTAGRFAVYASLDAIRARAPYRPWTQEMINMFGEEEEVTFTFMFW